MSTYYVPEYVVPWNGRHSSGGKYCQPDGSVGYTDNASGLYAAGSYSRRSMPRGRLLGSKSGRSKPHPCFHAKPIGESFTYMGKTIQPHYFIEAGGTRVCYPPTWEGDVFGAYSWFCVDGCSFQYMIDPRILSYGWYDGAVITIRIGSGAFNISHLTGYRYRSYYYQTRYDNYCYLQISRGGKWSRVGFGPDFEEVNEAIRHALIMGGILRLINVNYSLPEKQRNLQAQPILHDIYRSVKDRLGTILATYMRLVVEKGYLTRSDYTYRSSDDQSSGDPPRTLFEEEYRYYGYNLYHPHGYEFDQAVQGVFMDMCETLPRMNDNNIQNILEVGSFIYELARNHRIKIPRSLQDAWLAYRYQFCTGKADVEDAIKFMKRHVDDYLYNSTGLKCYGTYTQYVGNIPIQFRCTCNITCRETAGIRKVWLALDRYGLAPDFYAIWDFIPYSFMVDWFLPVSDVLNVVDAGRLYNELNYDFHDIVFSCKYLLPNGDNPWSVYYRWIQNTPPELTGYYWLVQSPSKNKKTWLYRLLDVVSLTTGKE